MNDAPWLIRVGHVEEHGGFYVSRKDPRYPLDEYGSSLYLHPTGLWRTACVCEDGASGWFASVEELWPVLSAAIAELRKQYPLQGIGISMWKLA